MFDDSLYNLMAQAVEESQNLWRLKKEYKKVAGKRDGNLDFLKKMEKNKERHVKGLQKLIKFHLSKKRIAI
ncbi:MAG: hypothetical protein V5A68_02905 [Candidatus Thermoplasmatota archaeon]